LGGGKEGTQLGGRWLGEKGRWRGRGEREGEIAKGTLLMVSLGSLGNVK